MKKIMIISDTHMPKYNKAIPQKMMSFMNDVDLIIHVGDFQSYEVYELFCQQKKVFAVHGNNDDDQLTQLLPRKSIIEIEDVKIGLFHGHGLSMGVNKKNNTLNRTLSEFKYDVVDLIIFGHSHIPFIKKIDNITLFNPGSPTNKRLQKQYSFGILTIKENHFDLIHIFYDDKI